MKKTQIKELLRSIKKTWITFLSVAVITGISVAVYLGTGFAGSSMRETAQDYFNTTGLHDFEISYAYGITEEDVAGLLALAEVTGAEGGYATTAVMPADKENRVVRVVSLTEKIDLATVLKGSLPAAANEVAVEEALAEYAGIQVGDTINLNGERDDGVSYLLKNQFTVTAVVENPAYVNRFTKDARGTAEMGSGAASNYVVVSPAAFDKEEMDNCYTTVYLACDSLRNYGIYSEEYQKASEKIKKVLSRLGKKRGEMRYTFIVNEAEGKIEDVRAEIVEAEAWLADGEDEIAAGKQELKDNLEKLSAALTSSGFSSDPENAADEIDAALKRMEASGTLTEGTKAGLETLLASISVYNAAAARLEAAEAELAAGKTELEDGKAKLAEAEAELAGLTERAWMILDRESNNGYRTVQISSENLGGLSLSFALVFVVVAVMVCYSSIGRMIGEQRVLIGAQKALGFRKGEIMKRYLIYSVLCAVLGSLIGCTAAAFVFEKAALVSYSALYIFDEFQIYFDWTQALIVTVITILVTGLSTYIACNKLIKEQATSLLRGEIPSSGKELFFEKSEAWKRLPLYSRSLVKNLLNDKKRLLMTIAGVAGCTALIVISLTIKLAVGGVPDVQYNDIFKYDMRLYTDGRGGEEVTKAFAERLDREEGLDYIRLQEKMLYFRVNNGKWNSAHVIAAYDDEYLSDYLALADIYGAGSDIAVPPRGALISRRAAEVFDIRAGDYIELVDSQGSLHPMEIAGVIENYAYHLLVADADYYKAVMGEAIDDSTFYINLDGTADTALAADLADMEGYLVYEDDGAERQLFDDVSNCISSVVLLFLVLSAIMAVMVLLNLCIMFINQKTRELTVMRVNGFTLNEARAYIYRDNIILTILGLMVGAIIGTLIARGIVMSIEEEFDQFIRRPSLAAGVFACAVSAFFMLTVNLIALRKIKKLKLYNVNAN